MLNRGLMNSHGTGLDWPFRRVQFREPEECQLLQLADVFAGAVAWTLNGHRERPDASPANTEFAEYILSKAGIKDASQDTFRANHKFSIWHRQLK